LLKSLKIIAKEKEELSMLARILMLILRHNHLIKDHSIRELTIFKLANLRCVKMVVKGNIKPLKKHFWNIKL
jgi:hypothetical protein